MHACGRANLQSVEEACGRGGDFLDGGVEGGGVLGRGRAETADLADVLEGGGSHVRVGHVVGVWRTQCLDASAHITQRTREDASLPVPASARA